MELKRGKHICELRCGSGVLIKAHFLLKMLLGFKNLEPRDFGFLISWVHVRTVCGKSNFNIRDTCIHGLYGMKHT